MELWEDQDLAAKKSGFQCYLYHFFITFGKLLNLPEPQLIISKMGTLIHISAGCEDRQSRKTGWYIVGTQ